MYATIFPGFASAHARDRGGGLKQSNIIENMNTKDVICCPD